MRVAPGPPSFPIVGALPTIGLGKAFGVGPPPHHRLAELAQTHGDVMSVQMGEQPWIVLSSPEAVHEAFVQRGSDFAGRPMVSSMSLSAGDGSAGFARRLPGEELRQLRGIAFKRLFSAESVARSTVQLEAEAKLLAEQLLSVGEAQTLRPNLRHCVLNMVLRYAFSARVPYPPESADSSVSAYAELIELANEIWAELTATQTYLYDLVGVRGDSLVHTSLRSKVHRRNELLTRLISERRAERRSSKVTSETPKDMLDELLASGLPDEDILYVLVDMFVAGVNTVATALEWTLYLTAEHPMEQARAHPAPRLSPVTYISHSSAILTTR